MDATADSNPVRLPVDVVQTIHRLTCGDARTEDMVLQFIAAEHGAKNLLYLPMPVALQIMRRPADFLAAVKDHCEPELKL